MTTCIAIQSNKGFTLATDGQLSRGLYCGKENTPKILKITDHIWLGFAGSYWMYRQLQTHLFNLDKELINNHFKETILNRNSNSGTVLELLTKFLFENDDVTSPFEGTPEEIQVKTTTAIHALWHVLFIGIHQLQMEDSKETEPYGCNMVLVCKQGAYELTTDGDVVQNNIVAVGSGALFVEGAVAGYLSSQYEIDSISTLNYIASEMDIDQQKELALKALKAASLYDTNTNNNIALHTKTTR